MDKLLVSSLGVSVAAIMISVFWITESLKRQEYLERKPKEVIVNYATDSGFRITSSGNNHGSSPVPEKLIIEGGISVGMPCTKPKVTLEVTETLGVGCKAFECNDGRPCDKTENEKLNEKLLVLLDHMNKEAKDQIKVAESQKLVTMSVGSLSPLPPATLSIQCGIGMIKIHFADGRVGIPEGVSLPEAAKMFWDAVGISFPEFRQAIISKYEKEKKEWK